MKLVIDIECNSLIKPTKIWLIVCKDIDTKEYHIFRNVTEDKNERERFIRFSTQVNLDPTSSYIGHNILGYDYPVLNSLLEFHTKTTYPFCVDTLIVSRLVDYSRAQGHSIEAYGLEFGMEKGKFNDWTKWSQEMEDYCVRDVDICHKIYVRYADIITSDVWRSSLTLEHSFQGVCNSLHDQGFSFNTVKATNLLEKVKLELAELDEKILKQFPLKPKFIREVHPKVTKHGTLSKTDFRFVRDGDLSSFNGGPFSRFEYHPFNPASHKQVINVLNAAGWSPTDKTQTHINTEREIQRQKYRRRDERPVDLAELSAKLIILQKSGWKINENNLATLPAAAPPPARTLAKRILLESRRRTLVEWLGLVHPDTGRIHGSFSGIGAWTHRMAHQKPNTANIPNDKKEDGSTKLLGKELRSLWQAPRNRLLVGVDAEGIQLRIFAHYIDDKEFTDALVRGSKANKTDPHSLNQRILGSVCKTRQAAKRFVYALLLGGGFKKLSSILEATERDTRAALDRLLERYTGFARLRETTIQSDAKQGFFIGLDGRAVPIPGDTVSERKHLAMSGYLQNGEAIVMKRATLLWHDKLKEVNSFLVDMVHDEWQTETPKDLETAIWVAETQATSLKQVGEELKLKCPLAGSFWNDDRNDYTIGTNWSVTH